MSDDAQASADSAQTPDTTPEADEKPVAAAPADDLEETKRKFREALDRKKQANAKNASGSAGSSAGKAQGAHGPASSRRSFRRKSG